jgi:hypothetical protein
MIKDDDYAKLSIRFLAAAQDSFQVCDKPEFTIMGAYDLDIKDYFVIVVINGDDDNTFMFTSSQARKLVPNLRFTAQFSRDDNYIAFVEMIVRNFTDAFETFEETEVVGLVLRRKEKGK